VQAILFAILVAVPAIASGNPLEERYQRDMDRVRIKHIDYVAFLILEYFQKTGNLPLADHLQGRPIEVFFPDRRADPAPTRRCGQARRRAAYGRSDSRLGERPESDD
jgi:hypothetical protein